MVVNIHDAKTHFSRLIKQALSGEEVLIARNGIPLLRLTPVQEPQNKRIPGLSRGKISCSEYFPDPLSDALSDAFAEGDTSWIHTFLYCGRIILNDCLKRSLPLFQIRDIQSISARHHHGRFDPWETIVQREIEKNRFQVLPVLLEHTYELKKLLPLHKDPFDRMLIAQALSEKLTLVSNDSIIAQYPELSLFY